jgi:hypothetical protein
MAYFLGACSGESYQLASLQREIKHPFPIPPWFMRSYLVISGAINRYLEDLCRKLQRRDNGLSRGQVIYPATPDRTAVDEGSSTSDVLLSPKTELLIVTKVQGEG